MAVNDPTRSDNPYESYNPLTDLDQVGDWLKGILPELGQFLQPIISSAIGSAMGPQFFSPGGFTGGFGSSTLFGTQNVGLNAWSGFNSGVVDSVIRGPTTAMLDARDQQLRTVYEVFAKDSQGNALSTGEIDRLMESPLTMTSFIHGRMFDQREPHLLNQGLRQGAQYMGVGFAPSSPDYQRRLQDQASAMTTSVSESFNDILQAGDWSGAGGRDVGRVFAETMRTGGFNRSKNAATAQLSALGADASEEDIDGVMDRLSEETRRTTQQAVAAVQSFRQIFKGSVTDVLGYVNNLMGTDVKQTFQDQGQALYNNFAATGMVTGFTRHQMAGFASTSAQFSQSQGLDPWGAVSSGTFAAQLMGVHRETGSNAFVNEARFRENLIRQITGAEEGGLARDISGAYAMIQGSLGDAEADAFMEQINSRDIRSGSQVAGVLNTFKGMGDVTAFDINRASYTMAGEEARMSGIATPAAMQANMGFLNRNRMVMLRAELSAAGLGARAISDIEGSLENQTMTIDNIRAATAGHLDSKESMSVMGALRMRYDQQAKAFDLGTSFEADQLMDAAGNPVLSHIQGAVADNVMLQGLLKHKGNLSGINNLNAYIQEIGEKGTKFLGSKTIYQALSGDTSITPGEIGDFANIAGGLAKTIKKETVEARGLDIALQGLFTRTVAGRAITDEETDHFQAIIGGGGLSFGRSISGIGERQAALKELGEKYGNFDADALVPKGLGAIKGVLDKILGIMEVNALPESGIHLIDPNEG